jgi:hypothetical protein
MSLDHLSHTQVSMFQRCPRQYYYRYVLDIKSPPGSALIRGTAVDRATAHNFTQKLDTGTDLPVDEVTEVAAASFDEAIDRAGGESQVDWREDDPGFIKDSSIGLTALHMRVHAPLIQPTDVQVELHREVQDGIDFVGFLDFETSPTKVGDVKTGGRGMGQEAADKDMQAHAYAYLKGHAIDFGFYRLIDSGKARKAEIVQTDRTEAQIDWYEGAVKDVANAVLAGNFPPNPTSTLCSKRWCGYFDRCGLGRK